MNAALILMTSALVAGSDCGGCAAPTTPSCATSCDPCAKVSLLDKLKARFAMGKKSHDCCDPCAKPAPTCQTACAPACAPAPKCAPACGTPLFKKHDCGCDPCAKPSLLERIKAKFAKPSCGCDTGCSTGCSTGCASGGCDAAPMTAPSAPSVVPTVPTTPAPAAPKAMPAPGKTTSNVVPGAIRPAGGNSF